MTRTINAYAKRIGLMVLGAVSAFACGEKFLAEVPASMGAPENFYRNATHAVQAVTGVYDGLQPLVAGSNGPIQLSLATDIMRGNQWGGTSGLRAYIISPDETIIADYWRQHYYAIKNANTAIENIPGIDMDEAHKNELVGEARFIRALLYFNLVRTFGAVPYVTAEFTSLKELHVARTEVATIYDGIVDDLKFAIEYVPRKRALGAYDGRARKEAAEGLLAKVLLTRGSMEKRDGRGDGMAYFTEAVTYAQRVMESGTYRLCPYFPDAFIRDNKNNDEILFDVQFKSGGLGEGNYLGMGYGLMGPEQYGGSWGTLHSTRYFHLMYEPTDTVRQEWTTTQVTVATRDVNGNTVAYIKNDRGPETNERWKIGKFRRYPIRGSFTFSDHDINWPFLRYAEILLIYAEAKNEADRGAPASQTLAALNELRWRARHVNKGYIHHDLYPRELSYEATSVPDLQVADLPTYEAVRDYIMDERARELGGEASRWFDLIRWGKLEERLRLLEQASIYPEGVWSDAIDDWRGTVTVNLRPHHYLLPLPSGEMLANPMLRPQNPGY